MYNLVGSLPLVHNIIHCMYLVMYPHFSTPLQLREPLPLSVLRQESCPHISAHDVISLCQLEYQALGYGGGAREDDSTHLLTSTANPLLKRVEAEKKGRAGKGGRKGKRGVLVDIRPQEEYLVHLILCDCEFKNNGTCTFNTFLDSLC